MSQRRERTLDFIRGAARSIQRSIEEGKLPELRFPIRSLGNVTYDEAKGYLRLGPKEKARTLTVSTVKSFAQTLRLMAVAKTMAETDDFATKREAYYVSKNWGACRFGHQNESDAIMDDIEALASVEGISREELGFYPEEHGGAVAGHVVVVDRDPTTDQEVEVDCTALGSGAYTIPHAVDQLRFRTDAHFILAIETGGMFRRLHNHRFWQRQRCVLVELGGVPTRATRRFIRRLSDDCDLPVYCFVDCDPYGFANIYRTLKAGSGNAAHINRFFSVPQARYLGVTPADIEAFGLLDATHPLEASDIKRARDALESDPFFRAHPPWRGAIEQLLAMGVRAEQQALAKWGLNYVMDEYLPRKLRDPESFLP